MAVEDGVAVALEHARPEVSPKETYPRERAGDNEEHAPQQCGLGSGAFSHRRSLDWAIDRLETLNALYAGHRRSHRRSDFVWGGAARSERLRRIVGGPGKRVLDLGCRTGVLTRVYASGNEVVGVDVDRDALAQAAELGIETVWADVEEPLPFAEASFDIVVAGELLEHLQRPDRLMEEIRRVLVPGGTIAGSAPNAYRLKNRLRALGGHPIEQDPTHEHLFRPRDLMRLLSAFESARLEFVVGRFVRLNRRQLANVIVFSARKPG
jgi:SAM-dependent methyltransferase